ncbi:SGNH/GDSL hydrolase family protein [uncultured Massilia sp.]|uniref:SGNH/GDSL hydrolase family protein n=1 Tax=uncultured Massilia sp. TaxID=169973 RepID=UPI002582C5D1|nr:SGNH/GDSL hydrolase family protein [uncultured Massilia sp.]
MRPVDVSATSPDQEDAPRSPGRRRLLIAGPALASSLALTGRAAAQPAAAGAWRNEGWCPTWGCAPAGPPTSANLLAFSDQTVRLVAHASIGGARVRVRLSNEFGTTPLTIGAAQIGLRDSGVYVRPGSNHPLTFGGNASVTIPPGAPVLSDPVYVTVAPFADLSVSLYLPGSVAANTVHGTALQAGYVSSTGNFAASTSFSVARTIASWPFLTEVLVEGGGRCIVAIGDSITDGAGSSTNLNRRWPDLLARRLQTELGAAGAIGVVNRGIAGNQMLREETAAMVGGRALLARFDRDVLATPGVRAVMLLIGINDICYTSGASLVKPADLIAGYRQLIARAHGHGVAIVGSTLMPFEGFTYYNAAREAVRRTVNDWLRASGEFDLLLDWEAVVRDPELPGRLKAEYNSKDWIHPNDAGYTAMAGAVPLPQLAALLG